MRSFVLESGGGGATGAASAGQFSTAPQGGAINAAPPAPELLTNKSLLDSRHTKVAGSSSSDSIVAVLFTITSLSEQGVPRGPMVPPNFES